MTQRRPRHVILIGYRGCGKTCVGRRLADELAWPFVDTDEVIEEQAGRTIRDIFATDGEPAFRALEQAAVAAVLDRPPHVVSVGGGAVLAPANRAAMCAHAWCLWLRATPETIIGRLEADRRSATLRPALTDRDPLDEARELLNVRSPLYAEVGDHALDTDGLTPDEVATAALAWLRPRLAS